EKPPAGAESPASPGRSIIDPAPTGSVAGPAIHPVLELSPTADPVPTAAVVEAKIPPSLELSPTLQQSNSAPDATPSPTLGSAAEPKPEQPDIAVAPAAALEKSPAPALAEAPGPAKEAPGPESKIQEPPSPPDLPAPAGGPSDPMTAAPQVPDVA